jgi:hypothetical protein
MQTHTNFNFTINLQSRKSNQSINMAPSYSKIRPKAPHGRSGRNSNRDGQATTPHGRSGRTSNRDGQVTTPHGRSGRTFNRDGQVTAPSGDQRSGDPGKVPQIAPWLNLGEHPNSTEKRLGFIPHDWHHPLERAVVMST